MMATWQAMPCEGQIVKVLNIPTNIDASHEAFQILLSALREELDTRQGPQLKARILVHSRVSQTQVATVPTPLGKMLETLLEARQLFGELQESPIPFIYVGFASSFDTLFELALSCKFRFFFGPSLKVGFPGVKDCRLPFTRAYDTLGQRNLIAPATWLQGPVWESFEAFELGIISASSSDLSYANEAQLLGNFSWLLKFLSGQSVATRGAGVKSWFLGDKTSAPPANPVRDSFQRSRIDEWMLDSWQSLSQHLEKFRLPEVDSTKLLTLLEDLRKAEVRERRYFINLFYHAFFATQPAAKAKPKRPDRDWYGQRVYIDCQQLLPPERVMKRLSSEKIESVYWHVKGEELQKSLSLVQTRWERSFSIEDGERYWERYAFWAVRPAPPADAIRLAFTPNDMMAINDKTGYRMQSNRGHSSVGCLEWFRARDEWDQLTQEQRDVFHLLSDRIFFTGSETGLAEPLSILIRILACEEIVRLGSQDGLSIGAVLEGLKEIGWPILGQEKILERFIARYWKRASFTTSPMRDWKRYSLGKAPESLKQFKQMRLVGMPKELLTGPNAVVISEHLLFFTMALRRYLKLSTLFANGEELDSFLAEAIGLPPLLSTIDQIVTHYGTERLDYQVKSRWFWLVSQQK